LIAYFARSNTPATTYTDTLSLHDALPIYTYSRINFHMLQRDEPYMLMNYAEVELLLAEAAERGLGGLSAGDAEGHYNDGVRAAIDRKSTRLNSSHVKISYAVFCLKKKNKQ